jgi:hypothetical protein
MWNASSLGLEQTVRAKTETTNPFLQGYQVSIFTGSERGNKGKKNYYHWQDLAVGKTIHVFGRDLLLTKADEFTQAYYQEHMGASVPDFRPIKVSAPCSCCDFCCYTSREQEFIWSKVVKRRFSGCLDGCVQFPGTRSSNTVYYVSESTSQGMYPD